MSSAWAIRLPVLVLDSYYLCVVVVTVTVLVVLGYIRGH
jgi:hypothetical protein